MYFSVLFLRMSIKEAEVVEIESILDSDKNNLKQIVCLKVMF